MKTQENFGELKETTQLTLDGDISLKKTDTFTALSLEPNSLHNLPLPISFKTLLTIDWPEEVFIEGGLLSRGDSLLIGGESKGGKSTILANLIREMIRGGNFLGFKVTKPLHVLMMQAELREAIMKKRLINKYSELTEEHLIGSHIWNTRGLIMIEREADLIKEMIRKLKPDVLVIDPIINFHDHEENDATSMAKFFRVIDEMKAEFDLSVIMSHHFRKLPNGTKQPTSLLESVRGSSAFRGWMDTTIVMEGRTKTEYRRVEFETRNSDEPIKRIIKYNKATKEFDWHNPLEIVYEMLCDKMGDDKMSTTQVINLILIHCGDLVSKNRTRAFDIKDLLLSTNQLIASEEGKTIYLEVVKSSEEVL